MFLPRAKCVRIFGVLSIAVLHLLPGPLHGRSPTLEDSRAALQRCRPTALRPAIVDLTETFGPKYPHGRGYLARLDALEASLQECLDRPAGEVDQAEMAGLVDSLRSLQREALLDNPLLDFDRLLLVKRRPFKGGVPGDPDVATGWDVGLPRSSFGNTSLKRGISEDEIVVLSPVSPQGTLTTIYKPDGYRFLTDVDLHFDAKRLLFSMRDDRGLWQIHQIGTDRSNLRQLTPGDAADVQSYDGCYLPEGGIVFASTACHQAVPCNGTHVSLLYRMDAGGRNIRQLTFDQDHSYHPVVMPSGRVMYLRWEYSELPHAFSRILFTMNPDGTEQMEYYGSNSLWPNAIFSARPVPSRPTQFVGIVCGHHGGYREGELTLFDVARGRHETQGVVQQIPGRGKKVEPIHEDYLTEDSWPKLAHPYPLGDKYFLAACKVGPGQPWDIYLVDVFDNMLPLYHLDGYALMEPIPLRPTPTPPVVPAKVDLKRNDALVYLTDVYRGPGLSGVPRGAVKRLRLIGYHYAYQGAHGALLGAVGLDGPWDVKRILGTVPVESDGSALFRVPANTPITLQPLDHQGKALQLMRSWLVGMPGETVSCTGCHDKQNSTPAGRDTIAMRRAASTIRPWRGPARNFSFKREVQPVLDKYCVGCHHGNPSGGSRPAEAPDLRGAPLTDYASENLHSDYKFGYRAGQSFTRGYFQLSRYVRRPGLENDIFLLMPLEYHADTTQLVQMLDKGHHNVKLDDEAWDRLITWIDLNAPFHGTWTEMGRPVTKRIRDRRRELQREYAGIDCDPESLASVRPPRIEPVLPQPTPQAKVRPVSCAAWPFDAAEAARRQAAAGPTLRQTVDLGDGVTMELVRIPAGEFVIGDTAGAADERPPAAITIQRPFWMGAREVTNRQFARFDPAHDSRVESTHGYQYGPRGFPANRPHQPVVRVCWNRAAEFCGWLSQRTGRRFRLPSEAQWEYACRAGTDTPMHFGGPDADFSRFANLADVRLRDMAVQIGEKGSYLHPIANPTKYDDWIPRNRQFNDNGLVAVDVGSYLPNAWGLHDMHGNVAEWTRSTYRPYPYVPDDGRGGDSPQARKVVRGGSWRDRPERCRSAFRLSYPAWQGVYNVGLRVVCESR